jgi:hypothetical protein
MTPHLARGIVYDTTPSSMYTHVSKTTPRGGAATETTPWGGAVCDTGP